jgi:hypothetical protein
VRTISVITKVEVQKSGDEAPELETDYNGFNTI